MPPGLLDNFPPLHRMQLLLNQEMTADHPFMTLAADYLNLFVNGAAFSDVVFSLEGKQVHAHRCILAARSSFFRMIFCKGESMAELTDPSGGVPPVIPVGVVSYDVFLVILQFLYSGQMLMVPQQAAAKCTQRGCCHTHCSSVVDLALDTLHAANFFGVEQLSMMIQKHLATILEKISIDDVLRVLIAARKQELQPLWFTCSELVAKSGLTLETLGIHLPIDAAAEIKDIRLQRGYGMRMFDDHGEGAGSLLEQRIWRMRQALDSWDVELVRLMVMGEGLDLDKAHALHYSVTNCTRDVVKALLELGAVDVNYPGPGGRTALHLASEMANPDMIAVLLDHHASPRARSEEGDTPLDILESLRGATGAGSSLCIPDHKLRLCLELVQSAMNVADKDDEFSDGVMTEPSDNSMSGMIQLTRLDHPDHCCSTPAVETLESIRNNTTRSADLNGQWASMESSCSLEIEGNHHHHLFNNNIARVAAMMNDHGHHMVSASTCPDFRMTMRGGDGNSSITAKIL